jgi:hypothetical protein
VQFLLHYLLGYHSTILAVLLVLPITDELETNDEGCFCRKLNVRLKLGYEQTAAVT